MKPRTEAVARRYARALLEVALEKADPGQLARELHAAGELLEAHPQLRAALAHPAVSGERKRVIATAAFRGASQVLSRLLELLVARERTLLLPEIGRAYARLWNAHRNVAAAEAVTAAPLATGQAAALAAALGRATGKTVELQNVVDPEILGGVLVKMEGRTFDGTVRGRLNNLRGKLVGGGRAF